MLSQKACQHNLLRHWRVKQLMQDQSGGRTAKDLCDLIRGEVYMFGSHGGPNGGVWVQLSRIGAPCISLNPVYEPVLVFALAWRSHLFLRWELWRGGSGNGRVQCEGHGLRLAGDFISVPQQKRAFESTRCLTGSLILRTLHCQRALCKWSIIQQPSVAFFPLL